MPFVIHTCTPYSSYLSPSPPFLPHHISGLQIEFFVGQSNYNVRNVLSYCDPYFVEDQTNRFHRLATLLDLQLDALLYGDDNALEVRPLLKVSPAHFSLFMQDGCVDNGGTLYDLTSCKTTFFDGLVGKGLQGAYKQYLQLARKVVEERYAASRPSNPVPCQHEDLDMPIPLVLEKLAERYLAAGFRASAHTAVLNADDYLTNFKAYNIILTLCSILALIIFFFAVYGPMIRTLDREIKNVRYLLLLFPDEISRVVPAIIAAGRELLKDGHVSAGSSVVSGASGASSGSRVIFEKRSAASAGGGGAAVAPAPAAAEGKA